MSFLTGPRLLRDPADCPPAHARGRPFALPARCRSSSTRTRGSIDVGDSPEPAALDEPVALGRPVAQDQPAVLGRPAIPGGKRNPALAFVRCRCAVAVVTRLRAGTTVHVRRIHSDPHLPVHALLPPHSGVVFHGERCDFPAQPEVSSCRTADSGTGAHADPALIAAGVPAAPLLGGSPSSRHEIRRNRGPPPRANPIELTTPASATAAEYPPILIFTRVEWSQFTSERCAPENDAPDAAPALCAR